MFARYSRYPGHAAAAVPGRVRGLAARARRRAATDVEGARAAELFERIFVGYGDDSVAQLGGAHIAVEWCSNVLTKILQRPRLAAYLEQSTRYIAYDAPMPGGGYRYYRDAALGPEYERRWTSLFDAYSAGAAARRARGWTRPIPAAPGESEAVRRRAVKAKALDLLRGLLPAASLSHMGIYASGQAYEQLILHLLAHPLPEARVCGERMLEAVKAVIPSFVARVERPGRGDVWVDYLSERRAAERRWAERLGLDRDEERRAALLGAAVHVDGDEDRLLAALLFEAAGVPEERTLAAVARARRRRARARCSPTSSASARTAATVPGRGFEALRYRFEIVSDYGAFRDLQRHRMLTVQWQPLTPDLGAEMPEEVVAAGCGDALRARAGPLARRVRAPARRRPRRGRALRALPRLPHPLRAGPQRARGDAPHRAALRPRGPRRATAPSPRRCTTAIAEHHPAVAATMTHVDHSTEPRLERILAEIRGESRRAQLTA